MNLSPIGEEMLLICMLLAFLAGIILGYAFGYKLKEKHHADEVRSLKLRWALEKIHEIKKVGAPKDLDYASVRTADGREFKARLPSRSC